MEYHNRNNKKPIKCKWCGTPRNHKFPHYSFCSTECRLHYEQFYRKNRKIKLVEQCGAITELSEIKSSLKDECCVCGYNKCEAALELHHINKDKGKSFNNISNPLEFKCEIWKHPVIVVCANCHREIHHGVLNEWDYEDKVLGCEWREGSNTLSIRAA